MERGRNLVEHPCLQEAVLDQFVAGHWFGMFGTSPDFDNRRPFQFNFVPGGECLHSKLIFQLPSFQLQLLQSLLLRADGRRSERRRRRGGGGGVVHVLYGVPGLLGTSLTHTTFNRRFMSRTTRGSARPHGRALIRRSLMGYDARFIEHGQRTDMTILLSTIISIVCFL